MSSFRSSATAISKFRNVYCDSPRADECWTGLQLSEVTGEQNYIKASSKYFAVSTKVGKNHKSKDILSDILIQ